MYSRCKNHFFARKYRNTKFWFEQVETIDPLLFVILSIVWLFVWNPRINMQPQPGPATFSRRRRHLCSWGWTGMNWSEPYRPAVRRRRQHQQWWYFRLPTTTTGCVGWGVGTTTTWHIFDLSQNTKWWYEVKCNYSFLIFHFKPFHEETEIAQNYIKTPKEKVCRMHLWIMRPQKVHRIRLKQKEEEG